MNKMIPLDVSLAKRLAAAQLENPFCGFCRTERAAVEELKAAMGFGAIDECDPLDPAVLSAMMPGLVPAEDGPNRQLEAYAEYHLQAPLSQYKQLCRRISRVPAAGAEATQDAAITDPAGAVRWAGRIPVRAGQDQDAAVAIAVLTDLEQAQDTIKEMGELIDQQAADITAMRDVLQQIYTGVHHHGWKIGIGLGSEIERLVPGIEK